MLRFSFYSFTAISSLQTFNVDLGHLQHGLEDSLRLRRIFVAHKFHQGLGNNLPRYAKFVLQPSALNFFSAGRELRPQLVNFRLRLAVHEKRYGWRKSVMRAAIQGCELLPFKLESYRHCGSFGSWSRVSVSGNV